MTTAEQLKAEGRAEGRTEEAVRILLTLVHEKFPGAVTAEAEATIANANLAQLDAWIRKVLRADTLRDVFTD